MKDSNINPASQKIFEVSPENMKIILWDIDGTMMRSTRQGAYKEYFAPAMVRVFGSAGKLSEMKVSGMTDTQIFYEALRDEGFTPKQILDAKENFMPIFKEEMMKFVGQRSDVYELLPGVKDILHATDENPQFLNALLTGNLSVAAEIKLDYFDLWKYFKHSPNLFGEISHDRRELGKAAVEIFSNYFNEKLMPEQFIIIGDTPNDVTAARAFGAKMISVATGRNHPKSELEQLEPDVLIENLADTKKVLSILESI